MSHKKIQELQKYVILAIFILFKYSVGNLSFILVGVDKSVISTTKLDLENVILTPRRKSKKRSGSNFPAAKKPRRQKCKKYIIEKGLVLAPEAFDRIKTDIEKMIKK